MIFSIGGHDTVEQRNQNVILRKIVSAKHRLIGHRRRRKVNLISFPKAGRTWVRMFLNSYYFTTYPFLLLDWKYTSNNRNIPYISCTHAGYRHLNCEKIIHNRYKKIKFEKILFLMRDPGDIFLSYYFHLKYRYDESKNGFGIDWQTISFSDLLRNENFGINKIIDFLNTWCGYLKDNDNSLIIFYEDLKLNNEKEFLKILNFIDERGVNKKAFRYALDYSSFTSMKDKESSGVFNTFELNLNDKNNENSFKVRKGEIGGFVKYADKPDIDYLNNAMNRLDDRFKRYKKL